MRTSPSSLLSQCSGAQLLMLAIANAELRPTVSRILDSRARPQRKAAAASRAPNAHSTLMLRRAG